MFQENTPMSLTDILQTIGLFVALIAALASIVRGWSERRKIKADTTQVYSNMLDQAAERERNVRAEIEKREHEYVKRERALNEKVESLQRGMRELKEIIEKKDDRIKELQELSRKQEGEMKKQEIEIKALRKELETLKSKN